MVRFFLTLLLLTISFLCGLLAYNDLHNYHFSNTTSWILVVLAFLIPFFISLAWVSYSAVSWSYSARDQGLRAISFTIGFIFSIISLPYIFYKIWINIEYPVLKWLILAIIAIAFTFLFIMKMLVDTNVNQEKVVQNSDKSQEDNMTNHPNLDHKDVYNHELIPKSSQVIENEKHNLYIWQVKNLFFIRIAAVGVVSIIMAFLLYHIIDITQQSADHNLLAQILLKQANLNVIEISRLHLSFLTEKELIAITALTVFTISSLALLIKVFLTPINTNAYCTDQLKSQDNNIEIKENQPISQKIVDQILNTAINRDNKNI
jgi:hypothetical protein